MNSRKKKEENSETIPLDLIIEILTRLPTKSIARFRCVSKLWGFTLRSPNFTESFFTISSSSPKLLFTFVKNGETLFFSSPQSQSSSSTLTATYHISFPIHHPTNMCRPVRGLVCGLNQETLNGERVNVPLICNPSTGQSLTLPQVNTKTRNQERRYLGYDPIDKQFKVLCITDPYDYFEEHQVLTLGTGKEPFWRMIKCDIPHIPFPVNRFYAYYAYDGICINGVLYYLARVQDGDRFLGVVCFDIRSDKFNCIRQAQGMKATWRSILVNYKGNLATLDPIIVNGIYTSFQLWVLQDAEKHQWSRCIYVLPPSRDIIFKEIKFYIVGMTSKSEIVLSLNYISKSFYLLYYNTERNTITKVEIQGMEAFKSHRVYTFLDHVEDVELMTED